MSWFGGASDWSYPRRIAPISQDAIMKKRQTAIEEAYAAQVRPRASPDRARGPFPPVPPRDVRSHTSRIRDLSPPGRAVGRRQGLSSSRL